MNPGNNSHRKNVLSRGNEFLLSRNFRLLLQFYLELPMGIVAVTCPHSHLLIISRPQTGGVRLTVHQKRIFFCQWTMRSEAILICLSRIENPIPCPLWVGLGGFSWNRYYVHKTPWIIKPIGIFVTKTSFPKEIRFCTIKMCPFY